MKRRSNKVPEESKKQKQDTLVSENRKLRKEVQQLRKQLDRINHRDHDIQELVEYIDSPAHAEDAKALEEIKKPSFECPKCYSKNTSIIELITGHYYTCNECGQKGKVK